jgi:uncharacterized membrane protein YdjX (TVP38/TMEM64 family)
MKISDFLLGTVLGCTIGAIITAVVGISFVPIISIICIFVGLIADNPNKKARK